jgi:RHS repeat-associated protein
MNEQQYKKINIRFAYQGQFAEEDGETGYNAFEARLWDNRIARWMSPDPAGQYWSPFLGMGNNGINYIDKNGEIGEKFMARMYAFWGKMQGYTHTNYWKADNGEWLASKGGFAKNFGQNRSIGDHLYDAWNSDISRFLFGDAIYFSLPGDLTFVGGGGYEGMLFIPIRGEYAFNAYITDTYKLKGGGHIGVGVNAGVARYNGPVEDINPYKLEGQSIGVDVDLGAAGTGGWAAIDGNNQITWFGGYGGLGPAIGGSGHISHTNKVRKISIVRMGAIHHIIIH